MFPAIFGHAANLECRTQTIIQLVLMIGSFPIMFFLVWKCVPDTNYFAEDNVIPPAIVAANTDMKEVSGNPSIVEEAGAPVMTIKE